VQQLGRALQDARFLAKLHAPRDAQAIRCGLRPILRELGGNPTPAAREQFQALLTARVFTRDADRVDSLIRASGQFRPPTERLVRFWRAHARPQDGFVNLTTMALVENGGAQAIALFEQLLGDPRHDAGARRSWMISDVMPHRNDLLLLQAARRLLGRPAALSPKLREALVEALFDYRPEKWFTPNGGPSPPPLAKATPAAHEELKKIAAMALKLPLDTRLSAAVKRALAEIDSRNLP
jgi:hypothetical protein